MATLGDMATSVSLSTRVSPELRERLLGQARARGVSLGELARDLLAAGVDGDRPSRDDRDGDGDLVNEIECVFNHLPLEAGVHRAVALALALTVENGGGGQVAAAKELVALVDHVRLRWDGVNYEDEDEG